MSRLGAMVWRGGPSVGVGRIIRRTAFIVAGMIACVTAFSRL
jgi:hypothetical protein